MPPIYSDKVLDHFRNPRNVGELEHPDGVGVEGNPVCGDLMEIQIQVEAGRIKDIRFKTFGCGSAIATSSMVTELVKGKTIAEALEISNRTVVEALGGLPSIKMHCSVLAEQALKSAIEDYYAKHPEAGAAPGGIKAGDACAAPGGKCVLDTAKST